MELLCSKQFESSWYNKQYNKKKKEKNYVSAGLLMMQDHQSLKITFPTHFIKHLNCVPSKDHLSYNNHWSKHQSNHIRTILSNKTQKSPLPKKQIKIAIEKKVKSKLKIGRALNLRSMEHRRRRRLGLAAECEPWLGLGNGASMSVGWWSFDGQS